jgi:hypothetical protein
MGECIHTVSLSLLLKLDEIVALIRVSWGCLKRQDDHSTTPRAEPISSEPASDQGSWQQLSMKEKCERVMEVSGKTFS